MRKEVRIGLLNIALPLTVGAVVYLTSGGRTYLSDWFGAVFLDMPKISYPEFIRNYACDFLWSYALVFAMRIIFPEKQAAVSALIIAFALETLQFLRVFPGTFDPLDLLCELLAVITAFLILRFAIRRADS